MRPRVLPDNATLLMEEAAGLSHTDIAAKYGVTRQAVHKRFAAMGEYRRKQYTSVAELLPWDFAGNPISRKLRQQSGFLGLRAYIRKRLGQELSPRSEEAMRRFLAHIADGKVLELDDVQGARYVERDPERDESLIIRWPEGVPKDERTDLFRYPPGQ